MNKYEKMYEEMKKMAMETGLPVIVVQQTPAPPTLLDRGPPSDLVLAFRRIRELEEGPVRISKRRPTPGEQMKLDVKRADE